jgi:uncharacterized alkaline shock family protein YloU
VTALATDAPASGSTVVAPALADPAERGTLQIADKVVQKIAAQAVSEVDLAGGAPRTLLGKRLTKADPDSRARADAHVDGGLVTLQVTLAVQWPAPVREVAEQARRHLTARVHELTGLTVAEVDVDVPALISTRRPAPRVR